MNEPRIVVADWRCGDPLARDSPVPGFPARRGLVRASASRQARIGRWPRTPAQPIPIGRVAVRDLTDAEFAELDELLAATPEPLEPLDVVMLDGYLCGVLVQPVLLDSAQWLPPVFDLDGRPLPDDHDPAWLARASELMLRRHAALNRAMVEDGWFDPLVLDGSTRRRTGTTRHPTPHRVAAAGRSLPLEPMLARTTPMARWPG